MALAGASSLLAIACPNNRVSTGRSNCYAPSNSCIHRTWEFYIEDACPRSASREENWLKLTFWWVAVLVLEVIVDWPILA